MSNARFTEEETRRLREVLYELFVDSRLPTGALALLHSDAGDAIRGPGDLADQIVVALKEALEPAIAERLADEYQPGAVARGEEG